MMVEYKEYGYSVDTNYIEFSFDRMSELSKSFKHHPITRYGVNYNYREADDPSTRKAQSGDYSTTERFHGKRTHVPKKSLADTFDKNFRKLL
ncbi:MAG TPA: hypothetical protein O0X84_01375 [Methanocorpusculum sp.]|nr:hypothetical protein [Methanocorpusculum sp.]